MGQKTRVFSHIVSYFSCPRIPYQDAFVKKHGIKMGFMSAFVKVIYRRKAGLWIRIDFLMRIRIQIQHFS
jgi:hypothetical protein